MSKEKLMPKLRFEDFIDKAEWIENQLKNMSQSYSGGTPSVGNSKFYNGNIPFIRSGEIYKDTTKLFITEEAMNNSSARIVHKGDILYALYGATSGEVSISKIDGAINQAILAIIPDKKYDTNFLEKYLNKEKEYILNSFLQGGQGNLSGEIIRLLNIIHPSFEEQQKIGSFFEKIDKMIQLQQSKVNKVKDIKSAYLWEMFPKEGEKYPKKRFEGFTNPWKEFSLEQVAKIRTGYPFNSNEFTNDGKYLVITNGNIQTSLPIVDSSAGNRITMKDPRIVDEYVLNDGDILVTMDGTVGRTAKVIEKNQILAQRVGRLTAYENSEFLYQALQTGSFYKNMSLIGHGGTIKHISLSEIGSYKITMPDSKEQNKVAEFFKNLDNQISIEEEKLAKLEKLKQAYLNAMFV